MSASKPKMPAPMYPIVVPNALRPSSVVVAAFAPIHAATKPSARAWTGMKMITADKQSTQRFVRIPIDNSCGLASLRRRWRPTASVTPEADGFSASDTGGYDAIRVYLWAGMLDPATPGRDVLLRSL